VYIPAPAPLIGHVTREALENYETWKTLRAEDYTPDATAVQTIASNWRGVRVLVIVGTWCKDSKRDLPRFFKVADLGKLALDGVTFIAVDRSKKDPEGLTETHKIERVPTFVFFRGDTEIGRVVEKPTTTLENDIAAILAK
jgi:thiol-disulfide isomerase/thioredoxin